MKGINRIVPKTVTFLVLVFFVALFTTCDQPSSGNSNDNQLGSPSGNSYTVVYNKNAANATGTIANSTFTIGIPQKLRANAFNRSGYTFAGWATSAAGSVKYTDGEIIDLSTAAGSTVTLYAVWEVPTETAIGATLADKLAWLMSYAVSGKAYTVVVDAYYNIGPQYLFYPGRSNITIHLKGDTSMRTVALSSQGSLFKVGSGVTLVLDNNITLFGRSDNNTSLVYVESGGTLIMNTGSKITSNTNDLYVFVTSASSYGGGVYAAGSFTMNGGEISDNISSSSAGGGPANSYGGGVYVSGSFTMNDGVISGNTATAYDSGIVPSTNSWGGGLYVVGSFTMNGGQISGNSASNKPINNTYSSSYGGGVYVGNTFTMNGGQISGNISSSSPNKSPSTSSNFPSYGGGVYVGSRFKMSNGEISGNNVSSASFTYGGGGGGVYVGSNISDAVYKTGGSIFGYSAGDSKSNTVKDSSGTVLSGKGYAVYVLSSPVKLREITAGPTDNLDSRTSDGWVSP